MEIGGDKGRLEVTLGFYYSFLVLAVCKVDEKKLCISAPNAAIKSLRS